MRPEVFGALSLAEYHRRVAAGLRGIRTKRRQERIRRHRTKEQRLMSRVARLERDPETGLAWVEAVVEV